MRWRKSIKYLRENPYLMDDAYAISCFDAERIYNSGFPTFDEFIGLIKEKCALPIEAWGDFDAVITERNAKRHHKKRINTIGNVIISRISQHRKLAIACLVVMIVTAFFTLVPEGRALAQKFFDMIVRVMNERVIVVNKNPEYQNKDYGSASITNGDNTQTSSSPASKRYNNMDEFIDQTGKMPIIIQSIRVKCLSIEFVSDEDIGQTLTAKYIYDDVLTVNVVQRWNSNADISSISTDSEYCQYFILGDKMLYYTIDASDKSFFGTALLDDSILMIGIKNATNIEEILNSFKYKE